MDTVFYQYAAAKKGLATPYTLALERELIPVDAPYERPARGLVAAERDGHYISDEDQLEQEERFEVSFPSFVDTGLSSFP